jgi:hypothetical protein
MKKTIILMFMTAILAVSCTRIDAGYEGWNR